MRFGSGSSKKVSIIVKGILDICSVVLLHCLFLSLLNGNLPLRYIGLPKNKKQNVFPVLRVLFSTSQPDLLLSPF